jgi:hypothetical protein
MKTLRTLGIVILLAGLGSLFFSNYIMNQVNEGKIKIEKGQKAVDKGNQLFSLNPVAKEVGKGLTGSAQKKIDAGQQQIEQYTQLAGRLQTGGIIAIVAGAGCIAASFFMKKKRG